MKVGDNSGATGVANSDGTQPVAPVAGKPFTTQGGETLQSIGQQAYGDASMSAALSAIHGIPADRVLPSGVNVTLPNRVHVELDSGASSVESVDDKKKRDAMSRNLSNGSGLNDPLKRTMAGLDRPIMDMPKTVASEDLKKKEVKRTVMGNEISADLKGAEMLSENSDTTTNADGSSKTTATATKASVDSKGMKADHKESTTVTHADGSAHTGTTSTNASLGNDGRLSGGVSRSDTTTNADGSSNSVTTGTTASIHGDDVKVTGNVSTTDKDADGNSVTTGTSGSVEIKDGSAAISGRETVGTVNTDADGNKVKTDTSMGVMVGDDKFKIDGSHKTTTSDADGNATTNGVTGSVGHDHLKVSGEHSETTVNEDGSSSTVGVSGGLNIDANKKTTTLDGRVKTAHTDADGNKTTDSVGGSVTLNSDGRLGTVTGDRTSTETTGDTSTSRTDTVKIDAEKGTVGLTDELKTTVKNEDGSKVEDKDKHTLDVNVTDPSVKASTESETKVTDADGNSVANRHGVSGGISGDGASGAVSGGRTTTDADGNSLKQDHKVGLDVGADKTTISGASSAEKKTTDDSGGHNKIGGGANVGLTIDDAEASLKASTTLNTEDKKVDGDKSNTIGTKHSVGIDTKKKDVSFSTGGSRSTTDKGRSSKTSGNVGFSLQDGVKIEGSHATGDTDIGSNVNVGGGLHIGRDGKPALVGDLEISNTNKDTGVKTGHGIGGGISAHNVDVGYRYNVTTPAGRITGAHVDVAFTRDKARAVVGVSDMTKVTTGTTTTMSGGTVNLLVGADDITVSARHNTIVTESGKILPSSFTSFGGFVSFRGNQLTTVGDKVTDEKDPNFGEYTVETTRKIGGSAGVDAIAPIASSGWFGIGGSLSVSADKEVHFRTHLTEDRAKNLAEAESRGKLKQRLAGATLIDAPIDVPDLSEPSELKVGDHIKIETRGTVEVGVFGSFAILVQAGVKASITGDFELTVDKKSDTIVEVEVVPTRVKGAKLYADAVLADAYVSYAVAQQIGQKFSFDLSTDSGRRAYQQALKGKLPGGLTTDNLDPTKHNLGKMQREFAPGVERLEVKRSKGVQTAASIKAGWLFLTSGARHARTRTHEMVSDGETSANYTTYSRTNERQTIISGNEDNGTSGRLHSTTIRTGPRKFETKFEGYTATAFFTDTKIRGDEYRADMIDKLNKDLDAELIQPSIAGPTGIFADKRSRRVEATVEFTPEDIVDIKNTTPEVVEDVAKRHNISEGKINKLIANITDAKTNVDAAKYLDDFLRQNGRPGLGALIKLAKMEHKHVQFSTESGSYQGVIKDSSKYLLENGKPITGGMNKRDLTLRYKGGEKLLKAVNHGLDVLDDDPIMGLEYNKDDRGKLKTDMQGKRDAIDNAVSFEHLKPEDALALWVTLDRGWTTGVQHRAQDRIVKEGGLTLHENGWTQTSASATTEKDGVRKEVSIRSSHKFLPLFGDERTQVAASVERTVAEDGTAAFKSFTFETRIVDEAMRWSDMNSFFVDRVNSAYGTDFRKSEATARGEQHLILRQTLRADDLLQIKNLPETVVTDAIKAAGASEEQATKFGRFISSAKDNEALVRVLEHFIQDEGILASGALHRIASSVDPEPEFHIDSISGAIKSDLAAINKTAAKYKKAIADGTKTKDISARFKALNRTKQDLKLLQARVLDYPFYNDEQRRELSDQLEALSVTCEKSLDLSALSHDAAVNLYVDLDRGWTSKTDYMAMERLKEDVGLLDASSSWTGGLRTGESLKTNEDGSSTFTSSATKKHGGFLNWGGSQEKITSQHALTADRQLESFEIKIELQENNATKGGFFSNFIERVNDSLGLSMDKPTDYPDDKHDRTVTVSSKFSAADILTLRKLHPTQLHAALKNSPCSESQVTDLLLDLRMAPDGEKQAHALAKFANSNGMEGMGALRMILEKPSDALEFKSSNGLLKTLQAKIDATLSIFEGTKITSDMSKKELTMRYDDIDGAQTHVNTMLKAVKHDPFLNDEERTTMTKSLEDLLQKLRAAFDPADLTFEERHQLISELEAGWTTRKQYTIIDELKYRT